MMLKSIAAAVVALAFAAACTPAAKPLQPVEGDSFLGPADAKVTVVEYGSPTCPACKAWHDRNWSQLKSAYVDSGKVKFVFRELAVHGAIDAAIFGIARCAGQETYFDVLDEAFLRQEGIVGAAASADGPRPALVSLGGKFGMSEEQVKSCIQDQATVDRVFAIQSDADARGVTGTPTFFINDRLIGDSSFVSMSGQIEATLAGTPAPADVAPAGDGHTHAPGEVHADGE